VCTRILSRIGKPSICIVNVMSNLYFCVSISFSKTDKSMFFVNQLRQLVRFVYHVKRLFHAPSVPDSVSFHALNENRNRTRTIVRVCMCVVWCGYDKGPRYIIPRPRSRLIPTPIPKARPRRVRPDCYAGSISFKTSWACSSASCSVSIP